jgi:hypothetical protein
LYPISGESNNCAREAFLLKGGAEGWKYGSDESMPITVGVYHLTTFPPDAIIDLQMLNNGAWNYDYQNSG